MKKFPIYPFESYKIFASPSHQFYDKSYQILVLIFLQLDDYRIFVGGLGPDVRDSILHAAFSPFGSITKARVIFNKKTGRSRCYGFVGFKDPQDFLRAMREMNGKYIGNRPVSLKRSDWKERARHDKV